MKIILDKVSSPSLLSFRKFIIDEVIKINPKFDKDLSNLHKYIQYDKINDIRIKLFKKINSKLNWEKLIFNLCAEDIFKFLGQDLLIQSKINLSIQLPNDETSVLPIHSDSWSSDSPFQMNLWIPLTNAFDTNSMFLFDKKKSLDVFRKISKNKLKNVNKLKINKKDFFKINFGQILFFNPALLHGNVLNKTKKTRVSLNLRVKSFFSPQPGQDHPDRRYGTYYKTFNISENTQFGIDIVKTNFFE